MICHLCTAPATGLYPAGNCCPTHTPARVAGRNEAPTPTGRLDTLSDVEHDRITEAAIAQLEKKQADKERRARRHHRHG